MRHRKGRLLTFVTPLLAGAGMAVAAAGAVQAGSTAGPLSCAILANSVNGAIALHGTVQTDVAVSGTYRFKVASAAGGGRSNMQQGGNFTAAPGGPVTLGRVMLGNPGAIYDAHLEIVSNGLSVECSERIGGAI